MTEDFISDCMEWVYQMVSIQLKSRVTREVSQALPSTIVSYVLIKVNISLADCTHESIMVQIMADIVVVKLRSSMVIIMDCFS